MTTLLQHLAALRGRLAASSELAPRAVCSDKALARLVLLEPRSPDQLEAALGDQATPAFRVEAGALLQERFGDTWSSRPAAPPWRRTCEAYNRGVALPDLLAAEGISLESFLARLGRYLEEGGWVPRRGLLEALGCEREVALEVGAFYAELGRLDRELALERFGDRASAADVSIVAAVVRLERRLQTPNPVFPAVEPRRGGDGGRPGARSEEERFATLAGEDAPRGEPFSAWDDARLWRAMVAGTPLVEVGVELGRWPVEVRARFHHLARVGGHPTPRWPDAEAAEAAEAFDAALESALGRLQSSSMRYVLELLARYGSFRSADHLGRVAGLTRRQLQSSLGAITDQLRRRLGQPDFELWGRSGRAGAFTVRPVHLAALRRALGQRVDPADVELPRALDPEPDADEAPRPAPATLRPASVPEAPAPPSPSDEDDIDDVDDALLYRLYLAGTPVASIGEQLDLRPAEVHRRFDRRELTLQRGGPPPHAGEPWTAELQDQLEELFYDGADMTAAALTLGRHRDEVGQKLLELDLPLDEPPTQHARYAALLAAIRTLQAEEYVALLHHLAAHRPPYALQALLEASGELDAEDLPIVLEDINEALAEEMGAMGFELAFEREDDLWDVQPWKLAALRRALDLVVEAD